MFKKQILWITAFFLVLIVGDRAGGWCLQQLVMNSQFRYSRLYAGRAGADILLIGNSRGLTFYEPYIQQQSRHTTFNLSYNGLPMDAAKVLAMDYLDRYPTPKVVLIDISTCDRTNDPLLSGFLPYISASYRLDTLLRQRARTAWWGGAVTHFYRYNNEIFQRALYHRNKPDSDWLLDRQIEAPLVNSAGQHHYDLDIHPYLLRELKELVEYTQGKGVPVRLVIGPYLPGFTVRNLDQLKEAAIRYTGLPVYDYRNALQDPALFGDFMHPNKRGAEQYIDLMRKDGILP